MDGRPVGLANLYDIDRGHQRCSWAYYLADPAVRGQGVGSYIEYWVLEYVFEALKLAKLWCEVLASTSRSGSCTRASASPSRRAFRGHVIKDGARVDVLGLGILAADWRAKPAADGRAPETARFEPPLVG